MMKHLYSFDIFDTCLVRFCGDSENMIEVLSYKVADRIIPNKTDPSAHEHMRRLFATARKAAEGRLECKYQQIGKIFPLPCSIKEMVQMELDTERDLLVPILATRKLIKQIRPKGDIVFISDMYLPTDFLREQLQKHGFFHEGDRIYVSDDCNAWKRDGSLFKLVQKKEGVSYRHWHHYGDNLHGDVKIPRRLGIHSHFLNYGYLQYEKKWIKTPNISNRSETIMAGVSRAVRLCTNTDKDQAAFVADISAPLLCLWMSHVLHDAKSREIKKIFFCARDVHSAYRVARRLASVLPDLTNIEIKYFFTSQLAVSNGGTLADQYYQQIGLIPTEHVAIVDSRTRGWSLARLQSAINPHNKSTIMAYYWHLDTTETENIQCLSKYGIDSSYHMSHICHNIFSRIASIKEIASLIEYVISLNYHHKTIGYALRPNGVVGPVFAQHEDEIKTSTSNVRWLKRDNDNMLEAFTIGFAKCELYRHTENLIHTLLTPTFVDFASQPYKQYLHYLTKIQILGADHPYVCSIYKRGNRKNRWLLGSIVYSLPTPIARLYCTLRYSRVGVGLRKRIKRNI